MGNREATQLTDLQNLQNNDVISDSGGVNSAQNSGGHAVINQPEGVAIEMGSTLHDENPNMNGFDNMGNMPNANPQWGNPNMGTGNHNMGNMPNSNPQWGNPNMGTGNHNMGNMPNANPQWGNPNMGIGSYNMGNMPNASPQWGNHNMGTGNHNIGNMPNANPQWGNPNIGIGSYNMGNMPNASPQWGNPNMGTGNHNMGNMPNANPQWGNPNMGTGNHNMGNMPNATQIWGNPNMGFESHNMGNTPHEEKKQWGNPNMGSSKNTYNIGFNPTRRKSKRSSNNMGDNPDNNANTQEQYQRIPDSQIKAKLFGVNFEVFGDFTSNQGFVNKKYIQSTGRFMTLTGWLEDTEQGSVRGYCEGHRVYIDALKYLISEEDHSVAYIDKTVFGEMKLIKEREFDKFMFRHDIMTPEIREFFTPRRPEYRLTRRPYMLSGQMPPWMANSPYDQMMRSQPPRTLGFVDS